MLDHGEMTLPAPVCTLGYTEAQLGEILGDGVDAYRVWAVGKTQGRCEGAAPCTSSHGIVDYPEDVARFIRTRSLHK